MERQQAESKSSIYKYAAVLCIATVLGAGIYSTEFVNGEPVYVSWDSRANKSYTKKTDRLMVTLQDTVSSENAAWQSWKIGEQNDNEIIAIAQKNIATLTKLSKQLEDIVPPESLSIYHSQFSETVKLRIEYEKAVKEYLTNPQDDDKTRAFNRLESSFRRHLDATISMYEKSLQKDSQEL